MSIPSHGHYHFGHTPATDGDLEKRERSLPYVALTRAKTQALSTSSGNPSPWLNQITSDDPTHPQGVYRGLRPITG